MAYHKVRDEALFNSALVMLDYDEGSKHFSPREVTTSRPVWHVLNASTIVVVSKSFRRPRSSRRNGTIDYLPSILVSQSSKSLQTERLRFHRNEV